MKTKITFLLAILFCSFLNYAQTEHPFIHYATTENTFGGFTQIDHPALNNTPNASVFVQKVRFDDNGTIINNPRSIGVEFYDPGIDEGWIITTEGGFNIPINSCYMIHIGSPTPFKHKAGIGTILPGFDNTSVIDETTLNDNSSARCMFTRLQDADEVQNNNPCELYYNWDSPGNWYMSTPPSQAIPIDSAFNILCNPLGFLNYVHVSTFDNIGSDVVAIDDYAYWTILDHVLLNNNPNALLFVNHRREPSTSFIYRGFSVFFNSVTGKWQLHIELESFISGFSFPIGNFFDIFIWDGTLDTSEFNITDNLKVYPNPSNSVFTVEAKQDISEVSILNVLGQELNVFSGEEKNKLQIDLSSYVAGHYFAKIRVGEVIDTVRLLKN